MLDRHSKCIEHWSETLYEESNGDVKCDLGAKVDVKSNIVRLKSPVATYLG